MLIREFRTSRKISSSKCRRASAVPFFDLPASLARDDLGSGQSKLPIQGIEIMRIRWRGLELPNRVASDRSILTDTYGKFTAEPFERGFGVTVGNSLRRVLLSSLEGSAVTRVKIQGVQHEISTIPGVVEDVTDIILNIKSLVVKNASEQPKTIRIDRHERGVITAASVIAEEAVQIINPEHIIATLTDDVPFVLEMTVENGRGYRTADENAELEREIGVITVDSSFSPVIRDKYDIEDTRVGQGTNYD